MAGIANPLPRLYLRMQGIRYGKNLRCYGLPVVLSLTGSSIRIGRDVIINSSFLSNLVGLYQRTVLMARDGGMIEIGDGVGLSGVTVYARSAITIGRDTLIGANTKLLDNDFHPVDPFARRARDASRVDAKPIAIGENVFIGCNCLILKGVHIGDNAVIGAGSVVSRDIPANSVAAGNPANVLKHSDERIAHLGLAAGQTTRAAQ